MANPEHLAILKQGVEAWNAWRDNQPVHRPDLVAADLERADLPGADLSGVDLAAADLNGADLAGADLTWADLRRADLRVADLDGAKLEGANLAAAHLRGARLKAADLGSANLRGTDLTLADLSGANFRGAVFSETVVGATTLRDAVGLEFCRHLGPSILDHRTLQLSGPLPLTFLRGCGLPDSLINYSRSVLDQPFQFHNCFISYSTDDQLFAERFYADLQNKGVRCWFAPHDMKIGDKIRDRIDESVRLHDKLLLILSKYSIASAWVEQEVETALRKERQAGRLVLFPIRLDDAVFEVEVGWAALVRSRHIGDFRGWDTPAAYQVALDRLLRDLKADTPPPNGPAR
jgi:uncharacterized protein YjbI with pentapeptide repeats